jgi:putative copper resistance protein D
MGLAELARALARGLHLAGSFSVFGTVLLAGFLLPAEAPPAVYKILRRLAWGSLLLAAAAGIAWFFLQTADMASASSFSDMAAALPIVARSTRFGHLLILRGVFLVAAAVCFQKGYFRSAVLLGGLAVVTQAWLGHGGAMSGNTGTILLISSIIHLTGGAAWIGSLPALFLMIARLPQDEAAHLARRYSPLGVVCVLALISSAIVQFIYLIGSPAALLRTIYGRVALFKIIALAGLITLASMNRYRFGPALLKAALPAARKNLLFSIGFEIALGLAALLAAGLLLNLPPPAMAAMLGIQP